MKNIAKSLLQMAKCVKESITHLKSGELGKAKFSLLSKEWEFAEMDYSKYKKSLTDHGVETFEGEKLLEYKQLNDVANSKGGFKVGSSQFEKLLGFTDPFAGITNSVLSSTTLAQ